MKNGLFCQGFVFLHTQDGSRETALLLNQFQEVKQKGFLLHILSDLNANEWDTNVNQVHRSKLTCEKCPLND